MLNAIAHAPTDQRERIVKAAVTAVYDRYCSTAIAELESAVVALIGTPIDSEDDEDAPPSPQPNVPASILATGTATRNKNEHRANSLAQPPHQHVVGPIPVPEDAQTLQAAERPLEQHRLAEETTSTSDASQTACLPGGPPCGRAHEPQAHEGFSDARSLYASFADDVPPSMPTAPSPQVGRPVPVRLGTGLLPDAEHGQAELEVSKVPSSPPPPINQCPASTYNPNAQVPIAAIASRPTSKAICLFGFMSVHLGETLTQTIRPKFPASQINVLPPVVTGQMEIAPDVTAAELGINAEAPEDDPPCTCCQDTGYDGNRERFCDCAAGIDALAATQQQLWGHQLRATGIGATPRMTAPYSCRSPGRQVTTNCAPSTMQSGACQQIARSAKSRPTCCRARIAVSRTFPTMNFEDLSMTNSVTHEDGLDPLAFNLASQRLNEAKDAIFASDWSERQQEMLADFAEAAADLLEMVKAEYLNRATPPQTPKGGG